jgi:hypothetical protein
MKTKLENFKGEPNKTYTENKIKKTKKKIRELFK